jgi:hypothetical protein
MGQGPHYTLAPGLLWLRNPKPWRVEIQHPTGMCGLQRAPHLPPPKAISAASQLVPLPWPHLHPGLELKEQRPENHRERAWGGGEATHIPHLWDCQMKVRFNPWGSSLNGEVGNSERLCRTFLLCGDCWVLHPSPLRDLECS